LTTAVMLEDWKGRHLFAFNQGSKDVKTARDICTGHKQRFWQFWNLERRVVKVESASFCW